MFLVYVYHNLHDAGQDAGDGSTLCWELAHDDDGAIHHIMAGLEVEAVEGHCMIR